MGKKMKEQEICDQVGFDNNSIHPLTAFILFTSTLLLFSILIVIFKFRESFIYIFIIPCLVSAFFYKRWLYLSLILILSADAVWVTSHKIQHFESSVINILSITAIIIITDEVIHRLMVSRKKAEMLICSYQKELQKQNEELRKYINAVEHSANTIVITDKNGIIEYVNSKFISITGYSKEEVLGKNPGILKSGEHDNDFYKKLWETINSGKEWHGEFLNRRKDNRLYWEAANIAPIYDPEGQITHFIAIKEDITAQKEAEIALQKYASKLETKNAELDAFAHTVAHDIKNPLSGINGYLTLLKLDTKGILNKEQSGYIEMVQQSVYKIRDIIDELLLLASVQGIDDVKTETLDMGSIVAEAKKRLEFLIRQLNARIVTPDTWPEAAGHRQWIEEVWFNYMSNALKYGGRPPHIVIGADIEHDGYICFWIKDNGPGLSKKEIKKLFTPFERLQQSGTKGHGLGLSIVQRIVKKSGGRAGVESRNGEGSRFYFTLPNSKGYKD